MAQIESPTSLKNQSNSKEIYMHSREVIALSGEKGLEKRGDAAGKLKEKKKWHKHTTAGICWWSPTQLLICRSEACVWQSGRDA
jgi:hypothetical protein